MIEFFRIPIAFGLAALSLPMLFSCGSGNETISEKAEEKSTVYSYVTAPSVEDSSSNALTGEPKSTSYDAIITTATAVNPDTGKAITSDSVKPDITDEKHSSTETTEKNPEISDDIIIPTTSHEQDATSPVTIPETQKIPVTTNKNEETTTTVEEGGWGPIKPLTK